VRALRSWFESPIADRDRRRAFAAAAIAVLLAAGALSLTTDPPDRHPTTPGERPTIARPDAAGPRLGVGVSPDALDVARRFIDGYLAHLSGDRRVQDIRGASAGLRRQLIARPIRVTPAMRRQRPRIGRIDGRRLPGGWLIDAEIATATVSFPIAVVVATGPGGLVVTRVVED
jgi:hypothetical protein